jgi:hypothetical protein
VNRRARQNKNSGRTVITMSQSEAFARRMARNDRTTLVGKILLTPSSAGPTAILAITPLNLGARAAALAALFSEYHINFIRVKFQSPSGVITVLGFLDDASGSEGDGPGSFNSLLEYRCSGVSMINVTIPTEFTYTQKSQSFWMKCLTGVSGSDLRLSVAAVLFIAQSSSSPCTVELDFSVTYQGAVDVSST